MFFYISFLRPPPLQSVTFGNIQITPQIANDLRTESFTGTAEIFYSWQQTTSGSSSSVNREVLTKPIKLTTWREATAYKEIPVPVPPGVRDGQSWRLLLGTRLTAGPDGFSGIDLYSKNIGQTVFPVMSMPIQFGPRASKKGPKQEQIERVYHLRPKVGDVTSGVALKMIEQTSFDLDKKVWDSGIGLSSWLVSLEQSSSTEGLVSQLKDALFSPERRNILELGGGIGIVGLSLAALRSTRPALSEANEDRVITTDLESAIPLIEHNISANAVHFHNTRIEAAVLDWDDDALPDYITEVPNGFDAIIMADVTYNTASFPSLVKTLSRLVQLQESPPLILLGYKERDAAERSLWGLVSDIGLNLQKVGETTGAGGAPIEIWIGDHGRGARHSSA